MSVKGKKIVLAVTGSIAAYKTPQLVRLLVKAGAEVQVLMTKAAEQFVTPLSLATVSKRAVLSDVANGDTWNNHVALGLWADAMLIAPCSANTLAKLAHGYCDNIVNAVYLSARCPVFIAPAMDEDMWIHPSTRANVKKVREYGNRVIATEYGELASGLVGEGRMAEPENIAILLSDFFAGNDNKPLKRLKAMVTAGPTYERLDPVRFIGNFSTGRMGIAIAEALAQAGAQVTLVCGPTEQRPANPAINTISIESAREMYEAGMVVGKEADIAVLAAAVADYKPIKQAENKIKKSEGEMSLLLTKTEDLLAALGKIKQPWQTLVGFALETENEIANAQKKLEGKNADMIVLNSLRDEGAGFGHDTNKITLLKRDGSIVPMALQSKKEAAAVIVDHIAELKYAEKTV
jgi:phosphopantothenoylcysteine decarboxylase / phosphopantothenate---cysteine ligase